MAGTTSTDVVAIRRRFVAAKYKAHARDMRRHRPRPPLAALRLSELERLYTARWGRQLPDDDAGRDDLLLAFNHISGIDSCIEWAMAWAPWLSRDDATALAEQITAAPQWLKARPMGERLGLTDYERTALKIRTIRPIDVTDACLAERRKQKDRDRKALRRQQRPGFAAMLKHIAGNGVPTIIVETANRFARDLIVQETGWRYLKDADITLIAADSPDAFLNDTPTAVMIRHRNWRTARFDRMERRRQHRICRLEQREGALARIGHQQNPAALIPDGRRDSHGAENPRNGCASRNGCSGRKGPA